MAKDTIKSLLKKGLTPDEAGRIYVVNRLTKKPTFSPEEIATIRESMISRDEKIVYNKYVDLWELIDDYLTLSIIASLEAERDIHIVTSYMKDLVASSQISDILTEIKKTKAFKSPEFKKARIPEGIEEVETFSLVLLSYGQLSTEELKKIMEKLTGRIANNARLLTYVTAITQELLKKLEFDPYKEGHKDIWLAEKLPKMIEEYTFWTKPDTSHTYQAINLEEYLKSKELQKVIAYIEKTDIASMNFKKLSDAVREVCLKHKELV